MIRLKKAVLLLSVSSLVLGGCSTLTGYYAKLKNDALPEAVMAPAPALPVVAPAAEPAKAVAQKPQADPNAMKAGVAIPALPGKDSALKQQELPAPVPAKPQPVFPAPPVITRAAIQLPGKSRTAPTATNDAAAVLVYRSATLAEDTIWRGEVLVEGTLVISPQTTLTIEPGTTVRFRSTNVSVPSSGVLLVQGRLVAKGSADRLIRFTSTAVDTMAGDWQGVMFLASEKKNIIEQARIEGAETGIEAFYSNVIFRDLEISGCGTGLRLRDSQADVSRARLSGNGLGLDVSDSELDLRDALVTGNLQGMLATRSSLHLADSTFSGNTSPLPALTAEESRLKITRPVFERNGSGLLLLSSEGAVVDGRIAANRDIGLQMSRSRLKVSGNDFSRNGAAGLKVWDGKGIAWGNVFAANGTHDIVNAGVEDFTAIGNWWGEGTIIVQRVSAAGPGKIIHTPFLTVKPRLVPVNSVAK